MCIFWADIWLSFRNRSNWFGNGYTVTVQQFVYSLLELNGSVFILCSRVSRSLCILVGCSSLRNVLCIQLWIVLVRVDIWHRSVWYSLSSFSWSFFHFSKLTCVSSRQRWSLRLRKATEDLTNGETINNYPCSFKGNVGTEDMRDVTYYGTTHTTKGRFSCLCQQVPMKQ